MRIDAHHHVWSLERGDYGWLTPDLAPLYRDFAIADLAPHLEAAAIAGTVLVQAAPSAAETAFLLHTAAANPIVRAVVGWADFDAASAPEGIEVLAAHPMLRGLRPMLQDLEDGWILQPSRQPALRAMVATGLRLDCLVRPHQLPAIAQVRQRFPGLAMVIDHGGKPDLAGGALTHWRRALAEVAADGVTCCKLSGLVTEAGPGWTIETLRPAVETILELFGPERVMWGSDWPVLLMASGYAQWMEATASLLAGLAERDRSEVMGRTAARFYALEV